jgi:hypothetical protein
LRRRHRRTGSSLRRSRIGGDNEQLNFAGKASVVSPKSVE